MQREVVNRITVSVLYVAGISCGQPIAASGLPDDGQIFAETLFKGMSAIGILPVCQRAKMGNGQVPIHLFAVPAGHTGLRVDVALLESVFQVNNPIIFIGRWPVAGRIDQLAKCVPEHDSAVFVLLTDKTTFMHQAMMEPTELYQVV